MLPRRRQKPLGDPGGRGIDTYEFGKDRRRDEGKKKKDGCQDDPVADDLATLALDMLVDEAGYVRSGPNLLLIGAYSG